MWLTLFGVFSFGIISLKIAWYVLECRLKLFTVQFSYGYQQNDGHTINPSPLTPDIVTLESWLCGN